MQTQQIWLRYFKKFSIPKSLWASFWGEITQPTFFVSFKHNLELFRRLPKTLFYIPPNSSPKILERTYRTKEGFKLWQYNKQIQNFRVFLTFEV